MSKFKNQNNSKCRKAIALILAIQFAISGSPSASFADDPELGRVPKSESMLRRFFNGRVRTSDQVAEVSDSAKTKSVFKQGAGLVGNFISEGSKVAILLLVVSTWAEAKRQLELQENAGGEVSSRDKYAVAMSAAANVLGDLSTTAGFASTFVAQSVLNVAGGSTISRIQSGFETQIKTQLMREDVHAAIKGFVRVRDVYSRFLGHFVLNLLMFPAWEAAVKWVELSTFLIDKKEMDAVQEMRRTAWFGTGRANILYNAPNDWIPTTVGEGLSETEKKRHFRSLGLLWTKMIDVIMDPYYRDIIFYNTFRQQLLTGEFVAMTSAVSAASTLGGYAGGFLTKRFGMGKAGAATIGFLSGIAGGVLSLYVPHQANHLATIKIRNWAREYGNGQLGQNWLQMKYAVNDLRKPGSRPLIGTFNSAVQAVSDWVNNPSLPNLPIHQFQTILRAVDGDDNRELESTTNRVRTILSERRRLRAGNLDFAIQLHEKINVYVVTMQNDCGFALFSANIMESIAAEKRAKSSIPNKQTVSSLIKQNLAPTKVKEYLDICLLSGPLRTARKQEWDRKFEIQDDPIGQSYSADHAFIRVALESSDTSVEETRARSARKAAFELQFNIRQMKKKLDEILRGSMDIYATEFELYQNLARDLGVLDTSHKDRYGMQGALCDSKSENGFSGDLKSVVYMLQAEQCRLAQLDIFVGYLYQALDKKHYRGAKAMRPIDRMISAGDFFGIANKRSPNYHKTFMEILIAQMDADEVEKEQVKKSPMRLELIENFLSVYLNLGFGELAGVQAAVSTAPTAVGIAPLFPVQTEATRSQMMAR
jgi:hypothetical protein